MDTRRDFIKKASLLSGGAGLLNVLPASVARALAIDPAPGTTYLDAEHIVFLMQENRSFDHTYGTLQGVRGFNDPRAITLPGKNLVWLQSDEKGDTYLPFRYNIKDTKITWMSSLPHSWSNQVDARNNGKYDKWLEAKHSGHDEYAPMPLTMGYYTRQDIPFYYSLADAFTVCDQSFCSALTGTTPNRLYFWSGTIREKEDEKALARVWNEDADYGNWVDWKTFPERLEENGISWKIYQNEISAGVGFEGEEDSWLGNFTDNSIEFFKQYNVKLHPEYIAALPKMEKRMKEELQKREKQLPTLAAGSKEAEKVAGEIKWIKSYLVTNAEDQKKYTKEAWDALTPWEKSIHQKAFVNNRNDPDYHKLTSLTYKDGDTTREVKVPKGDILHQFRQDVGKGQLPTVSWLVAPENYSDHPGAAWYGAWYISEVMDILTKNPEVWKKTVFILTYDENDGYFDHVPPFVAPHPHKEGTGAVSKGIRTDIEYVSDISQQSKKEEARESPIGLGYRVPMVVASPWSRGGWVNSQVVDHTSSLQFLEKFLNHKLGKKIEETNISEWRRTVCGDLTSVFRPYNGEKISKPAFLEHDGFIKSIHQAQFKNPPSDFRKLTKEEITKINKAPYTSGLMAVQEEGIRSACALPYELYVEEYFNDHKKHIELGMKAANTVFGASAAGSPFHVYTPGKYKGEDVRVWSYAVRAGDEVHDKWMMDDFENGIYHLQVYGPNGFFREYKGDQHDPFFGVACRYEQSKTNLKKLTGNIVITILNAGSKSYTIEVADNVYKTTKPRIYTLGPDRAKNGRLIIPFNTRKSHNWYDCSIRVKGNTSFERRFAGRVETGAPTKTDPLMGRMI
jgi:phospholipase C